jgi:hypothetical protein
MRRPAYLLGIAVAALFSSALHAQRVEGILIVGEAGVPAANARVWLTTTRGLMIDTARSDAQGRFSVSASRPGRYILNVRRLGYFPEETDPIQLAEGEVRRDTVYVLSARVLKPVEVVVRREVSNRFGIDIKALSSANVITPEEIDRVRPSASDLRQLIQWYRPPSLTMTTQRDGSSCYRVRLGACALVYVDGMLWGTDAWIPASEVESIVIIPGNQAFLRYGSANGVIAVFTNIWSAR